MWSGEVLLTMFPGQVPWKRAAERVAENVAERAAESVAERVKLLFLPGDVVLWHLLSTS